MKLTQLDYYRANDPGWLKMNPDKLAALKAIQGRCPPRFCSECYFCKRDFEQKGKRLVFKGFSCAIGGQDCPDEGRSDKCPIAGEKG